jgi:hypothetical protein
MKKPVKRPTDHGKPIQIKDWSLEDAITVDTLSSKAQPEYVAWIDLMGGPSWMAGSIRRAAEIIGLIHIAGIRAARKHNIKAYPVIDGIYIIGKDKEEFRAATNLIMRTLAITFLAQKKSDRRFLVRGGIAYGRVLHGTEISKLHTDLSENVPYSSCLALGISIGQAYAAESKAPPFGYFVDTTARSTASVAASPYISAFHRWWRIRDESQAATRFGVKLDQHFEYLRGRHRELEYPLDRLEEHKAIAREYFKLKTQDVTLRGDAQ